MQVVAYFGSSSHWLIFAIVCLLVFGASRLPELARNLGKSLGILKKARREFEEELMRSQHEEAQPKLSQAKDESPEIKEQEKKDTDPV